MTTENTGRERFRDTVFTELAATLSYPTTTELNADVDVIMAAYDTARNEELEALAVEVERQAEHQGWKDEAAAYRIAANIIRSKKKGV